MKALEQTGGALHSFDIDARAQNVYTGTGNWNFRHLKGNLEKSLEAQILEIGDVELWIDDLNHGYLW